MKIACLQFAPQVGDVSNNLNRADAVLAKANPDDLEGLDLIVLPELAFTGYNFKSLNAISPFLEPQGSGISALWARTTALKYDTNVIVGYPERVDVSVKWPTGPEYYSSAIVVNGDGETIANYRKSFLYAIDETWALEGEHGFFAGDIPGLGSTAMGICMDLNPYRFETPWNAFEFGYHIQAVEANLVIVSMAWLTREDGRHFTRMPEEPDTETLTYWVQRLEPLIRSEGQEEVIVVFCNRTGIEAEVVYAGTSSVVGIKDGEVKVYGILGRGVKDLLVVDTENGPFAKLIQRPEVEDDITSQVSGMSRRPRKSAAAKPSISKRPGDLPLRVDVHDDPRRPISTPEGSLNPRKTRPQSPRIQIPDASFYKPRTVSHGTPIDDSPGVATPTCPSPTPLRLRPNVDSPRIDIGGSYSDATRPDDDSFEAAPHIYDSRVSIQPPEQGTTSPSSGQLSKKYFWSDTQAPLKSPMAFQFPDIYKQGVSYAETPIPSSIVKIQHGHGERHIPETMFKSSPPPLSAHSRELSQPRQDEQPVDRRDVMAVVKYDDSQGQEFTPPRPSSPKSRNASRTGRPLGRRLSEVEQPDLSRTVERLESIARRPGSAASFTATYSDAEEPRMGRAHARQSSITALDLPSGSPRHLDKRLGIMSPSEIPMIPSPGMASDTAIQSRPSLFKNGEKTTVRPATAIGMIKPCPRAGARSRKKSVTGHSASLSQPRPGSTDDPRVNGDSEPHIEPDETRTLVWSELQKMVGEVLNPPPPRDISRGRHRLSGNFTSSNTPPVARDAQSETRARPGPRVIPRAEQRFASQARSESSDQLPMRTTSAPAGTEGATSPYDPDDEIVAEIIFHSQGRPAHGGSNSPQERASKTPPSHTPAGIPARPVSSHRAGSGQRKAPCGRSISQQSTPHRADSSRSRSSYERCPSVQESHMGKADRRKLRENPSTMIRTESNDTCPTMDGASILTISSQKSSPGTPPARFFDPTTPKAMTFDAGSRMLFATTANSEPDGGTQHVDALQRELMNIGILRPKSVVW